MEAAKKTKMSLCLIIRMALLVIVLLAGLFWTWFAIASSVFEQQDAVGMITHSLLPGIPLLLFALLAMRYPFPGGLLLTISGAFYYFFFHVQKWEVAALLLAPPIVAGLWALFSAIMCRPKRAAESGSAS